VNEIEPKKTAEQVAEAALPPEVQRENGNKWIRRFLLDEKNGVGAEGRRFFEALVLLHWTLAWRGGGRFALVQPDERISRYYLYGRDHANIEAEYNGNEIMMGFRLRDCELKMLDGSCLSVEAKGSNAVYLLIPNYDLEKADRQVVLRRFAALKRRWRRAEERARVDGVTP
jgi:hypothetical protein